MTTSRIRWSVAVTTAIAAAAAVLVPSSAGALAPVTVSRHDGDDRYEVARLTAATAFPGGADHVLLARGDLFPDALAASYLAGFFDAPILLTTGDALHPDAQASLDSLDAVTVHVLGGTAAISDAVVDELDDLGYLVERVAGTDRFRTATIIAGTPGAANVGILAGKRTALLASGINFPDALAGGPVAYAEQFPVLLTDTNSLTPVTATALDDLDIQHVLLLGGTAAVSDDVSDELVDDGMTVARLAGLDRFGTAAAIANFARDTLGWTIDELILATGSTFPDAEVAGPLGGEHESPIILAGNTLPAPSQEVCSSNQPTITKLVVQADTSAVSDAAVNECVAAAEAVPPPTTGAAWVWANDAASPSYTPDALYQYSTTGAANTIVPTGTGQYTVRFPGLGAIAGGVVHVTAYGTPNHCKVVEWFPDGDDIVAAVACFTVAGVAADARFTALFHQPSAGTGALAYVWADEPSTPDYTPDPLYQYSSTGATNTVTRTGTGDYTITMPGLAGDDGTVMVTAYGSDADRCKVFGWAASGADQRVIVRCFDAAGAASDSQFTATFVRNGGLTPLATKWAYAWASQPASAAYAPAAAYRGSSTSGAISATRSAAGSYVMTFDGFVAPDDTTVHVSAYGSSSVHCTVLGWGNDLSSTQVSVRCFNSAGALTDSVYVVSFLAP